MSKSSWPELEGKPWEEAKDHILKEYPNISIQVLRDGTMVTMDYREDRVRLFTNEEGKVVGVPQVG